MRTPRFAIVLSLVLAPWAAARAHAAVVADPAYIVGAVALPDVNAADVAVAGTSLLVGQGPFGAGAQSIIRLDADGTATTLVTGLNALGGIDYDAENDRMLFTDNGLEQVGATTGDTVYGLASPLTQVGSVAASTLALLPAGSIDFAQAVVGLASGDVLIGDAAGPGAGRVVKLSGGIGSNLITLLDYTAGIAVSQDNTLLIGNVDGSFTGAVHEYSQSGAFVDTLASGLSGAYDQVLDANGNLLLTGGFRFDFSSSNLVSITPGGTVAEIAYGFGFSSGITIDALSGQVLVVDFGVAQVDTLTPVNRLTHGGTGSKECNLETWGGPPDLSTSGKQKTSWTCNDGDTNCDRDGVSNGSCTFLVGACFTVSDPRVPKCSIPTAVDGVTVTSKLLPAAATALATAAGSVLPSSGPVCSGGVAVSVPKDRRRRPIVITATAAGKRVDKDTLKLRCL